MQQAAVPQERYKSPAVSHFASADNVILERDIHGRLDGDSGVKWLLSRDELQKRGLCAIKDAHESSVLLAQVNSGCKVEIKLSLSFGKL